MLQPLAGAQVNLQGLSAMAQRRFDEASALFERLRSSESDPTITFNLAYVRAMQGDYTTADTLLDDTVLAHVPAAIGLKMQVLHHLAQLDEVIALGKREAQHPEVGEEIRGLLASALLDAGDMEECRHYAAMAGDTAVGCAVNGMLALDDAQNDLALQQFERALERQPQSARARLGEGLALLAQQHYARATQSLDQAAETLSTHAGSWVAAGWAHLINGEPELARARFERAKTLEPGFSEAIGGLAMVCIHEGDITRATHWAEAALRLDRESLSGRAAQSLLLAHSGNAEAAQAMYRAALDQPLGLEGKTIAMALARRGLKSV